VSSCGLLGVLWPCGCFVVAGAGFEAAVQDADEPVGQLAQRGVVFGAAGFELVVVGPGAGGSVERAEGLGHEGVDEPVVVHESGEDDLFLAGGAGDRAGAGVVLPGLRVGVPLSKPERFAFLDPSREYPGRANGVLICVGASYCPAVESFV